MHERKGNYMPCKWKRKKGGCHGLLSRGREEVSWILYRGDAHTTENVNLLVFLIGPFPFNISHSAVSSTYLFSVFIFLVLFLSNLPSFFVPIFLFFFSSVGRAPFRPRADEKACAERTDGVNPSRAKSKRRTAVSWSFTRLWRLCRQKEDCLELLRAIVKYPNMNVAGTVKYFRAIVRKRRRSRNERWCYQSSRRPSANLYTYVIKFNFFIKRRIKMYPKNLTHFKHTYTYVKREWRANLILNGYKYNRCKCAK